MTVAKQVFPVTLFVLALMFPGCVASEALSESQVKTMEEISARCEVLEEDMEWPVEVREATGITVGPDGEWWSATGLLESWPIGYHQKMTVLARELLDYPVPNRSGAGRNLDTDEKTAPRQLLSLAGMSTVTLQSPGIAGTVKNVVADG